MELVGSNVIRLGSNLILTRLLFPEAFGLMALVVVVLAAAVMFSDLGIRGSVIQHPRGLEPAFLDTAWTFQIVRGFVLGTAIFALATPLARFYDEPLLRDLLRVVALFPVIQGFNSTQMLVLQREVQLGRLTVLNLGTQILGVFIMVGLALWLQSVWALMVGMLVPPLATVVLSHLVLGGHPNRLGFDLKAASSLLSFGKYILFASAAGFLVNQGDKAVLGKFVSLDDLAFYNIALTLATIPLMLARALSDKVIYPLYARRPPNENQTNKRKIDRARRLLTLGLVTAAIPLAIFGDWLTRLLYDPRYYTAGPLLILIVSANLPFLITESYLKMPLAAGRSGLYAIFQSMRAFVQFGLLLLMIPAFGLLGAVLAPGLATLIIHPFLIWIIRRFGGWDPIHDAVFFTLAALLGGIALWINWPTVIPVLTPLIAAL
jgi:O-antigen/teichoic acid export membrane protein